MRNPTENNRCSKKLGGRSRTELYQLRQKNLHMLNNKAILQNLSDKGAKLKETNELIDALLEDESTATAYDMITVNNTSFGHCPLTKKLEALSLLTSKQGARKKSVDLANQQALYHSNLPKRLLRTRKLSINQSSNADMAKSRMLTMDESLKLQISKREDTLDVNNPSRKLLNSLNLSLCHTLQKNLGEYEFPVDEMPYSERYIQETTCEDMVMDE